MKRFVFVLLLALLSNLASASFVLMKDGPTIASLTVHDASHVLCHDGASGHSADTMSDQHHPIKHHGCCPTLGLHRSVRLDVLSSTGCGVSNSSSVPSYTDMTYAIYKPPKNVA